MNKKEIYVLKKKSRNILCCSSFCYFLLFFLHYSNFCFLWALFFHLVCLIAWLPRRHPIRNYLVVDSPDTVGVGHMFLKNNILQDILCNHLWPVLQTAKSIIYSQRLEENKRMKENPSESHSCKWKLMKLNGKYKVILRWTILL